MARFLDSEGYERTLDFLEQPRGLDAEDVRNTAIEVDISLADGRTIPLWVMHPERCLRSRVENTLCLARTRHSQSDSSELQSPSYQPSAVSCLMKAKFRGSSKINERVFDLAYRDRAALRLYLEEGVDVSGAVLEDSRLPKAHPQIRLPQLRARLQTKRERLERVRAVRKK